MNGDMDDILNGLLEADMAEKLKEAEANERI